MTWEFSPAVKAKAATLEVSPKGFDEFIFEVKSGENLYRVQLDFDSETRNFSWIMCSCKHGLNNGGNAHCAHAAAVLRYLKD